MAGICSARIDQLLEDSGQECKLAKWKRA